MSIDGDGQPAGNTDKWVTFLALGLLMLLVGVSVGAGYWYGVAHPTPLALAPSVDAAIAVVMADAVAEAGRIDADITTLRDVVYYVHPMGPLDDTRMARMNIDDWDPADRAKHERLSARADVLDDLIMALSNRAKQKQKELGK